MKYGCCGQCLKLDWGMAGRNPLWTSSLDESPLGLLSKCTHLLLCSSYLFHKMHEKSELNAIHLNRYMILTTFTGETKGLPSVS